MAEETSRRDFLKSLGVTVGGAAVAASAGVISGPAKAEAQQPKGTIPDKPYKIGHMTFFTGAAAVLGEPSFKGHILAAVEIIAQGGLLGK
ncbi:MAG: twin-arginine translocation signal domain-containing protein, partial [candidate division NC10 bacterium]